MNNVFYSKHSFGYPYERIYQTELQFCIWFSRLSIMAGATVDIKQTKEYKNCQNFTNFKDFLMCNIINTFYISGKILSDKCIYDIIQKNTINN